MAHTVCVAYTVQCVHYASLQCKLLVMVVLVTGGQDVQPRPGCSLVSGLTIGFSIGLDIGLTIAAPWSVVRPSQRGLAANACLLCILRMLAPWSCYSVGLSIFHQKTF